MGDAGWLLQFTQAALPAIALAVMVLGCSLRIGWILRFPGGKEHRTYLRPSDSSHWWSGTQAVFQVALPWTLASARRHPLRYVEFMILHLGIAASILASFLIPYAPAAIAHPIVLRGFQIVLGAALLAGASRLRRRMSDRYLVAISTPDDYFAISLVMVWLAFGILAVSIGPEISSWPRLTYFLLTSLMLIYVPFGKILHYIYYPFARWYLGRTLGYAGGYPPSGKPGGSA